LEWLGGKFGPLQNHFLHARVRHDKEARFMLTVGKETVRGLAAEDVPGVALERFQDLLKQRGEDPDGPHGGRAGAILRHLLGWQNLWGMKRNSRGLCAYLPYPREEGAPFYLVERALTRAERERSQRRGGYHELRSAAGRVLLGVSDLPLAGGERV